MTKASAGRKAKKGIQQAVKRDFTPQEALELQELQRLVNARVFEYNQVKNNTALIPRGQELAKELEAVARLLEQCKLQWVQQKLLECGYPPNTRVDVNLSTGAITPSKE